MCRAGSAIVNIWEGEQEEEGEDSFFQNKQDNCRAEGTLIRMILSVP